MTDTVDRATDYQDEWLASRLAAARPAAPVGPSLTICIDCDDDIPEARRAAVPGCTRCMPCESDHRKRGGRNG
ncbi:MAG: TraR/DksA C4-type zinc finger protein [Halopseudomonas sp.]|uniref:TraR/DksA C4-type zinc finger protein n=1 Tax=Halopseudomonas sp. TaxID=2901191 RepID=UPI0030028D7A